MTSIDSDLTDFRAQAVAASEAMQRTLPRDVSLEKSGISYCLVRQPSLTRLRAPIKATAIASGVLGLAGVATGLVIGLLLMSHVLAVNAGLIAIAICCFVGGTQLMFVPTFVERWIVRHYLSQRDDDNGSGSPRFCWRFRASVRHTAVDVTIVQSVGRARGWAGMGRGM